MANESLDYAVGKSPTELAYKYLDEEIAKDKEMTHEKVRDELHLLSDDLSETFAEESAPFINEKGTFDKESDFDPQYAVDRILALHRAVQLIGTIPEKPKEKDLTDFVQNILIGKLEEKLKSGKSETVNLALFGNVDIWLFQEEKVNVTYENPEEAWAWLGIYKKQVYAYVEESEGALLIEDIFFDPAYFRLSLIIAITEDILYALREKGIMDDYVCEDHNKVRMNKKLLQEMIRVLKSKDFDMADWYEMA